MDTTDRGRRRVRGPVVAALLIGLVASGAALGFFSQGARPAIPEALAAFACVASVVFVVAWFWPASASRSRTARDGDR